MAAKIEEDIGDGMESVCGIGPQSFQPQAQSLCYKCKDARAVVAVRQDVICRECFLKIITQRFKTSIRGRSGVTRGDKLLVGFSGGFSSRAMLHLMNDALTGPRGRKMFFEVTVMHIDERDTLEFGVSGWSSDDYQNAVAEMERICMDYEFPFISVPLWRIFQSENENVDEEDARNSLRQFLSAFSSPDVLEDVIRYLRNELLARMAVSMDINKVVTGDTSTTLASRILSSTSKGVGFSLPLDVAYIDNRRVHLQVLRPQKDMLRKEAAMFCRYCNPRFIPSLCRKSLNDQEFLNIAGFFNNLIVTLQQDFPNTVPTLLRTAEKLANPYTWTLQYTSDTSDTLGSHNEEKQSSDAVEFGQVLCALCSGVIPPLDIKPLHDLLKKNPDLPSPLEPTLCYGCRIVLKDLEKNELDTESKEMPSADFVANFPEYVIQNSQHAQRMTREAMRMSVAEFLLSDEE